VYSADIVGSVGKFVMVQVMAHSTDTKEAKAKLGDIFGNIQSIAVYRVGQTSLNQ
jgi:hypothetical protein